MLASGLCACLGQVLAHLADEFARRVRPRLEAVGDFVDRLVAHAQFVFVDQRVVDSIDMHLAQLVVVESVLEAVLGHPMLEAERLEKILVDDIRAGADDRIDHVIANHVGEDALQSRADKRSRQAQDHAAVAIAQHAIVNRRRAMQVAGAVRHLSHRLDDRHDAVARDIDMFDRLFQKF